MGGKRRWGLPSHAAQDAVLLHPQFESDVHRVWGMLSLDALLTGWLGTGYQQAQLSVTSRRVKVWEETALIL